MNIDDMVIISVDDHIVEPPDMFKNSLPKRYADIAPRVVHEDGHDFWVFDGAKQPNIALNATVGRPPQELGIEPNGYHQIRRGCYDVHARIGDMNANGIVASMNFGTFVGFGGELFLRFGAPDTNYTIIQAYNDWHIDEWCAAYPGRFIPLAILPLWDPELMVAEARRVAAKGCTAVAIMGFPTLFGLPSVQQEYWAPLWQALEELEVRACIHIGAGGGADPISGDTPIDAMYNQSFLSSMNVAIEYLWSPVVRRYKNLKLVLSEGGIGWIPAVLERADFIYERHSVWTGTDLHGTKPSEMFRERFVSCFISESQGLAARDYIGVDNITYECDYPHSDTMWPEVPERLMADFVKAGCSDEEINKISHGNAIRIFGFDPIALLGGRDKCTVKALRAQATDVDLGVRLDGGTHFERRKGAPITASDFAKMFPWAAQVKPGSGNRMSQYLLERFS